jgi:hypothetical protein
MALQPGVGLDLHYYIVRFRNKQVFYGVEVVNLTPNPQTEGPGYSLSSGPSPSTCPARVTLPVANANHLATQALSPGASLRQGRDTIERGTAPTFHKVLLIP